MELESLEKLKGQADELVRYGKELMTIKRDISQQQSELRTSGSTKTLGDVNEEFDKVQAEW
jgi:hypothetical protein